MPQRLRQILISPHAVVSVFVAVTLLAAGMPALASDSAPPTPSGSAGGVVDASDPVTERHGNLSLGTHSRVALPADGLAWNTTYDLTFTNITTNPNSSNPGRTNTTTGLRLVAPSGVEHGARDAYADGSHAGRWNVTFPATRLGETGSWKLLEPSGAEIARFLVRPVQDLVLRASPNPVTCEASYLVAITFRVADAASGAPVGGARLAGPGLPPYATTDANGTFVHVEHCPAPAARTYTTSIDHGGATYGNVSMPEREGSTLVVYETPAWSFCCLAVAPSAQVGEHVRASANLTNVRNTSATAKVTLLVNGMQRMTSEVPVAAGETVTVVQGFTPAVAGNYNVTMQLGSSTPLPPRMVHVYEAPVVQPAVFRMPDVRAGVALPVGAPILVENVSDFGTVTLRLVVDPAVVEILDVAPGNVPGANLTWSANASSGELTLLVTTHARPGVMGSFVLANVSMRAVGAPGDESSLALALVEAAHSDGGAMQAIAKGGVFRAGIIGDVDGDGIVTLLDADLLGEFVVGARGPEGLVLANADANRDGRVSGIDAMFVRQHARGTRAML